MRRLRLHAGSGACVLSYAALILLAWISLPLSAAAKQAASDSVTCDVTPRSVADILTLLERRPKDGEPALTLRPVPQGTPADVATTAAVTAVVRHLEACINTGDQLRVYALFSDDLFQQPLNEEAVAELKAELTALANATPTPIPAGQRQILSDPWHVEILEDGRVMAAVRFSSENETNYPTSTKALFFIQEEGQWLIEEMVDFVWVEGSDDFVPVEDIVGPPPDSWHIVRVSSAPMCVRP